MGLGICIFAGNGWSLLKLNHSLLGKRVVQVFCYSASSLPGGEYFSEHSALSLVLTQHRHPLCGISHMSQQNLWRLRDRASRPF